MAEVTEIFDNSILYEDVIDTFFEIQLDLKNDGNELTFTTDELYLFDSFRAICQQYRSMQQLKMQNVYSYNKLLPNFISNIEKLNDAIKSDVFEQSHFENINEIIFERFNNAKKDYVEFVDDFTEYMSEFLNSVLETLHDDL